MQLEQRIGTEIAVLPQVDAAFGNIPPVNWIDMENYHHAMFVIDVQPVGATGTTAQVQQADNAAGDNPVDLAGFVEVIGTASTGVQVQGAIPFSAADVNAGDPTKQFVGIDLDTTVNDDVVGGVFIGFPQRYT